MEVPSLVLVTAKSRVFSAVKLIFASLLGNSCPVFSDIESSVFCKVSVDFLGLPVLPRGFFFGRPALILLYEKLSTDEARDERDIESLDKSLVV
ncbi:unnamed protein product [Meloidogyne enterolobii]|uniref:Uncharacterized protein n=1 Tax=Meloidogyne enterolobii TaxID=390850 RepID=A0ACB0YYB6_MELEN